MTRSPIELFWTAKNPAEKSASGGGGQPSMVRLTKKYRYLFTRSPNLNGRGFGKMLAFNHGLCIKKTAKVTKSPQKEASIGELAGEVNVPCCRDISTKVCVIKSPRPPPPAYINSSWWSASASLVLCRIEESIHAPPGGMSTIQFSMSTILKVAHHSTALPRSSTHQW